MAAVVEKKGVYYLDYRVKGRRFIKKVGNDKRLADKALYKLITEITENKFFDIKRDSKVTFKDYSDYHLKTYSSEKKEAGRLLDERIAEKLCEAFGERSLYELTPDFINKYKNERKGTGVKGATVNRELAFLKTVLNHAVRDKKLQINPMSNRKVRMFKEDNSRVRYLEPAEKEKLLDACMKEKNGIKTPRLIHRIITVLLNTGIRKGELQKLEWRDVDFRQSLITLRDTKNGETRRVPLNQDAKAAILAISNSPQKPESQLVFCKKDGESFNFRKSFATAVTDAKILNFRIHDARHHFASWLAMMGVDLNTIRELLGHKSLTMTLRYSHLSPDHTGRAVELLCGKVERKWKEPIIHEIQKAM